MALVTIKANLYNARLLWEHISAVEYFLDKEKVTGSIPVAPTKQQFQALDQEMFEIYC